MTTSLPRLALLQPSNGGLAVARAVGRRGVKVDVLATPNDAHTARTRFASGRTLPTFATDPAAWMAALHGLADAGPTVVLCGSDEATEFLVEHRSELPQDLAFFERMDDVHLALMDKTRSFELCRAAGVRAPDTIAVSGKDDVERALAQAPYPCVLKPTLTHLWRPIFGIERVLFAHDRDELRKHLDQAVGAGLAAIVSEYVPGDDECMEEAILVRAPDGTFPMQFGCHKLRQSPRGFGASSLCESEDLEVALDMARTLLEHAAFVGVAGIEIKRHVDTGERYFIEANVRIPTQFGLGDVCGAEASWRTYAVLAGLELGPAPRWRAGVKLVLPELEIAQVRRFARGERDRDDPAGWRAWLRTYRGTREVGVLDVRDPGPLLTMVGRAVGRRLPWR